MFLKMLGYLNNFGGDVTAQLKQIEDRKKISTLHIANNKICYLLGVEKTNHYCCKTFEKLISFGNRYLLFILISYWK